MDFCQQLWGKFLKLTELYHISSEHNEFSSRVSKTVTISFLSPLAWALVPGKIKECSCLEAFNF